MSEEGDEAVVLEGWLQKVRASRPISSLNTCQFINPCLQSSAIFSSLLPFSAQKTPRFSNPPIHKLYPSRYFLMTSLSLTYYTRPSDITPKGVVDLTSLDVRPGGGGFRRDRRRLFKVGDLKQVGESKGCLMEEDDVRYDRKSKSHKPKRAEGVLYAFKVLWYYENLQNGKAARGKTGDIVPMGEGRDKNLLRLRSSRARRLRRKQRMYTGAKVGVRCACIFRSVSFSVSFLYFFTFFMTKS